MTTCERGEVIVVNVPYTNGSGIKARPALVVSTGDFHRSLPDVMICPISSQPRYYDRPGPGDHPLRRWRQAKLRYRSTVRVSKILTVDKRMIKTILGRVAAEDLSAVESRLREALSLD
jgi:mRNA interferase MazF